MAYVNIAADENVSKQYIIINPAAAGPPHHPPAAGGGHKVAPLYFCEDIVATRGDREAKLCTHLPEYLAEVVCKYGVDPI